MKTGSSIWAVIKAVLKVYNDLDHQIAELSRRTDLQCPEACGLCCENSYVESTILEVLPLASEIYFLGKEEEIFELLRAKTDLDDFPCALYRHDTVVKGNGRCTFYPKRPLLCRLFGFAARKNKYGKIEFAPCRIVKQETPEILQRIDIVMLNGINPPVYQESFLRVAALLPSIGFKRLPINQAVLEALAYLQWKKPRKRRHRKAA